MDIFRMQCFVNACNQLSITHAAASMHISQPAMSTQIHETEKEVGAVLFIRRPHGLEVTSAGKLLCERFTSILETYKTALSDAASLSANDTYNLIRIGYHGGNSIMSDNLRKFKQIEPNIEIVVQIAEWDDLVLRLENNELDAIFTEQSEISNHSQLLSLHLFTDTTLVVALSSENSLAKETSLTVRQVTSQHVYMNGHKSLSMQKMLSGLIKCGFEKENITLVEGLDAELTMAELGAGIAPMPKFFSMTTNSLLSYIPVVDGCVHAAMVLAWRSNDESVALQKFIKFNKELSYPFIS